MLLQIILKLLIQYIHATIDLNLPELQYIANHLHLEECRRLVASLYFKSYEEPKELDLAETSVSKDIPCIKLLLHWNSQPGEGKGETHEILQHRLRQIDRSDLADWIGKTVFHELGVEMMENLNRPFEDMVNVTDKLINSVEPMSNATPTWNPTEWIAFDTICWVFIVGLTSLAIGILLKATFILFKKRRKQKRTFASKNYESLQNTSSESEVVYDISAHT
ncbi:hypothetical protein FQA39_LY08235 [Lamprigera yunnana]|nr:hypothetical protein FQA39_LY08235 [Lamprigera yunnana]